MKTLTSTLTDIALDWAIASARGLEIESIEPGQGVTVWRTCALSGDREATYVFKPSRDWDHAGKLVDELITRHRAMFGADDMGPFVTLPELGWVIRGATALEAAGRAYVTNAKGTEVELPLALTT